MQSQMPSKAEVEKRERLLLMLIADRLNKIADKYPSTRRHIDDLHVEILNLTIDWE